MATIKSYSVLCKEHQAEDHDCQSQLYTLISFDCDRCQKEVTTSGGHDVTCQNCDAEYNGSGQRLRDDWRGNPSNYDDEIGDMEGYEMQHAGD